MVVTNGLGLCLEVETDGISNDSIQFNDKAGKAMKAKGEVRG